MKKFKVEISSYVIVEADNFSDARREVEAEKEAIEAQFDGTWVEELFMNGQITSVNEETNGK